MKRTRWIPSGALAVLLAVVLVAACGGDKPEEMLASAKQYLAKNDRSAAVIQLKNALQKNPDLAEGRFLLGRTLLETGDLASAEKELRKAAELNHPADQVAPELARLLVTRGQYQKVIDEFGQVKVSDSEARARLSTARGEAYHALRNVDAARVEFAAALAAIPDYPPALLETARLKAESGDIATAVTLVDTALAKSPALSSGWQLKGDLLVAQGKTDPAIDAYRKAVEAKPGNVAAQYTLVVLLTQTGKVAEGKEQFAAMKKAAPNHPQTLFLQALLAMRDGNYTAAREAIQLQLKAAPGNAVGTLLGAQIDFELGSYAQAEAALVPVLQRAPNHAFARRLLTRTYLRQGKTGKARETLEPVLQLGHPDSNTLALAGEVYLQSGDAVKAAGYFEQATALDPKNLRKRTATALVHVATGESERGLEELEAVAAEDAGIRAEMALVATSIRQRKYDAALAAIDAIEKKLPGKPMPLALRGSVLYLKGDRAGARKSFERALAADPAYFPAASSLAGLDVAEGKAKAAQQRFDAVLEKDPKNAQALLAVAALRAQAGDSADVVAELIAKAVAAKPTDAEPRLALIGHWLRNNDYRKAVAAAREALSALPDQPEILDAAGHAFRAAGDTNQAIQTYNRYAQLRPDSPLPLMRLADLYVAEKNNAAALDSLRKAIAIKPDYVDAQRAIVALDVGGGRTKEALAAARQVQKQRPKESVGYELEGNIYASSKDWTNAIAAYTAGLKKTGNPMLAQFVHSTMVSSGKAQDASAYAAAWLKDHPKDRAFQLYLAQRALASEDFASAVRQYKAMLEMEPDDAVALNNLAWAAGRLKDPKALEYAEKADKLAPNNPAILDTMGMLLVDGGDVKRGTQTLQRAVTLAPNAPAIRLNLARALIKDGQKDAAKRELQTLANLGDKFASQAEVAKLMQGL
jgi:putative PEP-CTERM system TPR-repeat lipoprotein